jgi:hypothetical protein
MANPAKKPSPVARSTPRSERFVSTAAATTSQGEDDVDWSTGLIYGVGLSVGVVIMTPANAPISFARAAASTSCFARYVASRRSWTSTSG